MIVTESIQALFQRDGSPRVVGGNTPFLLEDTGTVWFVQSGRIDLFSVRVENGQPSGPRFHFFSVETGGLLFGTGQHQKTFGRGLLAVGMVNTQLLKLDFGMIQNAGRDPRFAMELSPMIETWVLGLSQGISKDIHSQTDILVEASGPKEIPGQKKFRPKKGVQWFGSPPSEFLFLGMEEIALEGGQIFPLSQDTWLETFAPVQITGIYTPQALLNGLCWQGLDFLYRVVLKSEAVNKRLAEVDESNRLKERAEASARAASEALDGLVSVLEEAHAETQVSIQDPLYRACQWVAANQGIDLQPPPELLKAESQRDPLNSIAKASRIRIRKVALATDWWKHESGPLLGFLDGKPVALLQRSGGGYEIRNPAAPSRHTLKAADSEKLGGFAYVFYRSFSNEIFTWLNLLRFGIRGHRDWTMLILMGIAGGVVGTLMPIGTALAFNHIVPDANRPQLVQLAIALLISALGASAFQFIRSIALLRIEGKMDYSLQSAVIDRLLKLPVSFFRKYNSGDLAQRAMAINHIRQIASSTLAQSVLINVFAVFNLVLLLYYNWRLALVALTVIFVAVGYTILSSIHQIRFQRRIIEAEGKLSGMVLQFLTGISKLRVAGAEMLAFSAWAKRFAFQKRLSLEAKKNSNRLLVFNSVAPILASALIFGFAGFWSNTTPLSAGDFLAFISAFNLFFAAMLGMTTTLVPAASIVPLYERLKPILETRPEVQAAKLDPGPLSGKIELSQISFRYAKDGPLILRDISMQIWPGEFVAVVGPSGSGKSTLLRLLLSFEQAETGSISYDGQDLCELEITAVRRQIGVVLQTGKLMPGNVLSNIIGSLPLTVDDAWGAARMAGLDEDIEKMPMGMHTMVSAGASLFSGGQQQRLMIARAIVFKPRILFFDEATSALDNRTQSLVSQSLEGLQSTRLVIAHRLSTILKADRIYVMDKGQIVQTGTYQELLATTGMFQELARRQMIDSEA